VGVKTGRCYSIIQQFIGFLTGTSEAALNFLAYWIIVQWLSKGSNKNNRSENVSIINEKHALIH
jgi:hypothetical protein